MENFLGKILEQKKIEIEALKKKKPLKVFYENALQNMPVVKNFKEAIIRNKINIIAEIKKASPSKGNLCLDMDILKYAKEYEKAGATAISVLTEKNFFKGSLEDLIEIKKFVEIPILRKDFIIDIYQVFESRFIGADAILLIADILDEIELRNFLGTAKILGLSCLVEVHDSISLEKAIACDAEIIGINNRCLKDFSVDIKITQDLAKLIPDGKIIVSESGITEKEDIKFLLDSKVKIFLIGEAFIKNENPFEKLRSFLEL